MSNDRTIDLILGRSVEVKVGGHALELRVPQAQELAELRAQQAMIAEQTPDEGAKITGEFVALVTEFNAAAVAAAAGCSMDQSFRLIAAAGGDESELVRAAQEACGLRPAGEEGGQDPN